MTERDFPRFPFFSSAATTIGLLSGNSRSGDPQSGVTLYLLDTVTDGVAVIPVQGFSFPEWLRERGTPPAFLVRREAILGDGPRSIPEVVITSAQKFVNGRYADDPALRGEIAGEEFKRAFLTKEELAGLKVTEFGRAAQDVKLNPALKKVIRLLWYGKMLGRGESLALLVDQLHPSVASAIRANQALNPK